MKPLLKSIKEFYRTLIARGKEEEQKKAGKKWDSIVKELKMRK